MFQTIRQVAASGLVPEHFLRTLVAQGKCPGVYAGTRFMVHVEQLKEMLDDESRRTAGGAKGE